MTPCSSVDLLALVSCFPADDSIFWISHPNYFEFNSWAEFSLTLNHPQFPTQPDHYGPNEGPGQVRQVYQDIHRLQFHWGRDFPHLTCPSISYLILWAKCFHCSGPISPHHPFLTSHHLHTHSICSECLALMHPKYPPIPARIKPKKAKKKKVKRGPKDTIEKHILFGELAEIDPYYSDPFWDDPYYSGETVQHHLEAIEGIKE